MSHITFPINSGQFNVLIDPEDLPRVTREPSGRGWCLNGAGYVVADLGERKVLLTRFLLDPPPDMVVIHLNDAKLDCRRANLLIATRDLALQRQIRRATGSSQYRGVQYHKPTGRWVATFSIKSKPHHLGYFDEEIDAALAYDTAVLDYYGIHARLNFPRAESPAVSAMPGLSSTAANPQPAPTQAPYPYRRSTSQYRGVNLVKRTNHWRASIRVNGQRLNLGTFPTERAAALAYDQAVRHHNLPQIRLNFPDLPATP